MQPQKGGEVMRGMMFLVILSAFFLAACGSTRGKYLLVDETFREPVVAPEDVEILGKLPARYELIGFVSASSDEGWNESEDLHYAVQELKYLAALIGANAVVLENFGTSVDGYVSNSYDFGNGFGFGSSSPVTSQTVSGKAIYIPRKR